MPLDWPGLKQPNYPQQFICLLNYLLFAGSTCSQERGSLIWSTVQSRLRLPKGTTNNMAYYNPSFTTVVLISQQSQDNTFRDFLLCKIVNGQHAAYNASKFKIMIERTRHQMLGTSLGRFPNLLEFNFTYFGVCVHAIIRISLINLLLGDLVQKFRMDTESKKRECHMENG